MAKASGPSLRLIFVLRSSELTGFPHLLEAWNSAFAGLEGTERVPACLWLTGHGPTKPKIKNVCVHTLDIPRVLDGYKRSPFSRTPWSPWGRKSGPNFQFFEILRRTEALHPESWVLQLESDCLPVRALVGADLQFLGSKSSLWVVGPSANFTRPRTLSKEAAQHINGASFYHVGSPAFQRFLAVVWVPSLLSLLPIRPALAYDILTSPGLWNLLPGYLSEKWEDSRDKFATNGNMINLSSRRSRECDPHAQLREFGVSADEHSGPWFLHLAKG